MSGAGVLAKAHAEVFALAYGHAAGQQFARGLQGVQRVPVVSVGVYLHGSDFHGRVQGGGGVVYPKRGGHVSERESTLQQNERLATALVAAGEFGPCPLAGLDPEALAQALFVGVELGQDLRVLCRHGLAALVGERIAMVLPHIIEVLIVQAKAKVGDSTLRVPAAPAILRRKDARARIRHGWFAPSSSGMDAGSLAAPLTLGIEHKHGLRRSRRRGSWNGLDNGHLQDHCRVLR